MCNVYGTRKTCPLAYSYLPTRFWHATLVYHALFTRVLPTRVTLHDAKRWSLSTPVSHTALAYHDSVINTKLVWEHWEHWEHWEDTCREAVKRRSGDIVHKMMIPRTQSTRTNPATHTTVLDFWQWSLGNTKILGSSTCLAHRPLHFSIWPHLSKVLRTVSNLLSKSRLGAVVSWETKPKNAQGEIDQPIKWSIHIFPETFGDK